MNDEGAGSFSITSIFFCQFEFSNIKYTFIN